MRNVLSLVSHPKLNASRSNRTKLYRIQHQHLLKHFLFI